MDEKKILEFIHYSEALKNELRHNWTSKNRQESVAEHSWRMSLMAMLMTDRLKENLDISKILKLIIIHDLGEIIAGDVPAYDKKAKEIQEKIEKESMEKLKEKFDLKEVEEIVRLWREFEKQESLEAKFVKALDKLEVRIQHNESNMERWNDIEYPRSQYVADKYCDYDEFLKEFNKLVKKESKNKIQKESNKDFEKILEEADTLRKVK